MSNPYASRKPDVFEARELPKTDDPRMAAPVRTIEDLPVNSLELSVPSGSIKEVLEWVNNDKARAQAALDHENAGEKPRRGLVHDLGEILAA